MTRRKTYNTALMSFPLGRWAALLFFLFPFLGSAQVYLSEGTVFVTNGKISGKIEIIKEGGPENAIREKPAIYVAEGTITHNLDLLIAGQAEQMAFSGPASKKKHTGPVNTEYKRKPDKEKRQDTESDGSTFVYNHGSSDQLMTGKLIRIAGVPVEHHRLKPGECLFPAGFIPQGQVVRSETSKPDTKLLLDGLSVQRYYSTRPPPGVC